MASNHNGNRPARLIDNAAGGVDGINHQGRTRDTIVRDRAKSPALGRVLRHENIAGAQADSSDPSNELGVRLVAGIPLFSSALWSGGSGRGASSGGAYSVSGTIGQANAGTMSGDVFTVSGGFWPGMMAEPEVLPRLDIRWEGDHVVLSWPHSTPGYLLQEGVPGEWSDVTEPASGWVTTTK